jgi:hypothetical protein
MILVLLYVQQIKDVLGTMQIWFDFIKRIFWDFLGNFIDLFLLLWIRSCSWFIREYWIWFEESKPILQESIYKDCLNLNCQGIDIEETVCTNKGLGFREFLRF